jgi:hypothetical protein
LLIPELLQLRVPFTDIAPTLIPLAALLLMLLAVFVLHPAGVPLFLGYHNADLDLSGAFQSSSKKVP